MAAPLRATRRRRVGDARARVRRRASARSARSRRRAARGLHPACRRAASTRHDADGPPARRRRPCRRSAALAGLDGPPRRRRRSSQVESFTRAGEPVSVDGGRRPGAVVGRLRRRVVDADAFAVTQVPLPVARRHRDRPVPGAPRRRRARRRTRRASSPATAASPSPRRPRGRRYRARGASGAACSPSPACGAATRRARRGTTPAAASTSRTCSTTSHAAADWLVASGRTSRRPARPSRGGSNGGLLVGAALTQRPDLCRAVHLRRAPARHGPLPAVPDRPAVDRRVRRPRRRRGVRLAAGVLAVPPRGRGHLLPGGAAHRGRGRQPRSTRSTPARWPPRSSSDVGARPTTRSCCARRAGPATGWASRATKQADELADVLAFLSSKFALASVESFG